MQSRTLSNLKCINHNDAEDRNAVGDDHNGVADDHNAVGDYQNGVGDDNNAVGDDNNGVGNYQNAVGDDHDAVGDYQNGVGDGHIGVVVGHNGVCDDHTGSNHTISSILKRPPSSSWVSQGRSYLWCANLGWKKWMKKGRRPRQYHHHQDQIPTPPTHHQCPYKLSSS